MISTHIIDALDEFYGVRRERRTTTDDDDDQQKRGGLIEEEDMNEFDEDVVCLSFENNNNNEKKNEDGKQLNNNNNNGIIDDDDDDKRNTMMMKATKTNNDKTTQTIKSSKTGLFDGIHNGIFSIGRGVSTGAQFLGDTVVSGVAVTTNASLYLGKTTVNIGKDAVMHSFNAISSTLITTTAGTTTTTTTTTTPSDVDEELIDDMSNVLLSEAPPRPRGLSIETILLDATTNTKRIATTTTTATLASSSLATCMCLCGNRIEKAKMEQRVCSYLRVVVCESCFSGDTRIIPRDVLHRWDFTEKPVCKQSLRFLEDAYAIPVISLRKLGEVNRYYYSTSISSKEEFTRLRGFLDLQIKVASLFHRVGEKLRLYNMEKDDEGKKEDEDDNDDKDDASKNKKRNRKALLHFLASIPDDKRRLVKGGDDAKVSIKELKELHEFRKQSEICEYLSAIEDEVVNVLESSF
tara:strand:- start:2149 stop:3540 length:1392 start_codon:yes stop_codon:yes gene_type:complete